MTSLIRIADRVLNRPLMILPDKLSLISSILEGRMGIDAADLKPDAAIIEMLSGRDASRSAGRAAAPRGGKPYTITPNGAAIIPVHGSLVNRGAWIGAQSGLTSYEGLSYQINTAAADADVKSIILDLDSPGGEAVGAFEAADLVRRAAGKKPVIAVVNGMAASAAYAIASGATKIVTTSSGLSGSVGVVMLHTDHSRRLHDAGIKPTLIHAGARKIDGKRDFTPRVVANYKTYGIGSVFGVSLDSDGLTECVLGHKFRHDLTRKEFDGRLALGEAEIAECELADGVVRAGLFDLGAEPFTDRRGRTGHALAAGHHVVEVRRAGMLLRASVLAKQMGEARMPYGIGAARHGQRMVVRFRDHDKARDAELGQRSVGVQIAPDPDIGVRRQARVLGRIEAHRAQTPARGALSRVGRVDAVPDRRMRLLKRLDLPRHGIKLECGPGMAEHRLGDGLDDQFERLAVDALGFFRLLAEIHQLDWRGAAAKAHLQAAAAHLIEHANFFRDAKRMIKRQRQHKRAEPQVLGPLRDGA